MSESGSSGRRSRSRGLKAKPSEIELNGLAEESGMMMTNDDVSFTETKDSLVHKIKSKLGCHNYHSKWICDFDAFERDANTVYDILTNKFFEIARQEDESELKYSALEVIGRKFTQLYIAAYLRKFNKMEAYLREANSLVSHCCKPENNYVPMEYLPGLTYCLIGIEAYYLTRLPRKSCTFKRLENSYKNLGAFRLLGPKAQVAVLAMKQNFIRHIDRKSHGEQIEILEQMIKLEPMNGDWYHWLYNVMRFQRRQQWQCSSPDQGEMDLIVKATKLSPKNPRILISLYLVMAEMVRDHGPDLVCRGDFLGIGREFESSVEIVLYLKGATRKILVSDPMSVKVNITIAEIFSSTLPDQYYDVVFSKMCIERALLFHPNSSKANARMGIFLLTTNRKSSDFDVVSSNNYILRQNINVPEGSRKEAIKYFIRSMEEDRRNFPTLLDLLFCYLADHAENGQTIEKILVRELANTDWTASNLGRLYFVKGLHYFLLWKHKKAVNSWIMTYQSCGDLIGFRQFGSLRRKYGWDSEVFDLNTIYLMANSTMGAYTIVKRNILRIIISSIREGMSKDKAYAANNPKPIYAPRLNSNPNRPRGFYGSDMPNRGGFIGGPGAKWLKPSNSTTPKPSSSMTSEEIQEYVQEAPPIEETAHQILGLESGATLEEIKKAFRKLCFEVHPDINPGPDGEVIEENLERMKKINVAFEELTSKRQRVTIAENEGSECRSVKN